MKANHKKLIKISAIIIAAAVVLYLAYRYWGISIIKSNMRQSMADIIQQKADENGTDFETQLHEDAKWVFNKNGFEWYK